MNISIVIPVYNASPVLFELHSQIDKVLTGEKIDYKLILVDDRSQDNSWEIMKALKNKFPEKIIAIRMSKNFGQHNAILCGFRYASGDFIITMDDDLQHPAEEIPKLLKSAMESGADVVYGISSTYKRSLFRNATSRMFKVTTRLTSSSTAEGSSFRIIKQDLVKKLITHNQQFVFIDEMISWYTSDIQFILVEHKPSKLNHSRYSTSGLVSLYFNLVFGYNATLLKLITYLGISSSFLSFLVGLFYLVKKIFFHVRVGFTGIVVSVTFTGGVILLSIGIIGEYLRRMYNIMNEKPQSSVSEVLE